MTTAVEPIIAHRDLIKSSLPTWLTSANPEQRQAYYASARLGLISVQAAQARRARLKSPAEFCRPLLQAELKRLYPNLVVDLDRHVLVRATHTPAIQLDGGIKTGELYATEQTLLEAALANFQPHEAQRMEPSPGYAVILPAGAHRFEYTAQGDRWYRYDRAKTLGITAEAFAALCRALDLGGQYEAHVIDTLNPARNLTGPDKRVEDDPTADLLYAVRDELALQAHTAYLKKDLEADAFAMMVALTGPEPEKARWAGQPLSFCQLTLLRQPLKGTTSILGVAVIRRRGHDDCVVYMPGEPDHVLKAYTSLTAFAEALRDKLRDRGYQDYFRRFVPLRSQVPFFERLNDLLKPKPLLGGLRQPDPQANLDIEAHAHDTSLLRLLHQHFLSKTSNDARLTVVPTALKNGEEHAARVAYYLGLGLNTLSVAAFFVPELGGVMAIVGGAQLITDLCVGVEEWQHHQRGAAMEHFFAVAENVAVVVATVTIGKAIETSPFVEAMVPVSDGGKTRLWNADLRPYESPVQLPEDAVPDAMGQHLIDGRHYVRIEGRVYEQAQDPATGQWTVAHPTDSQRFRPPLQHNRAGAWRHSYESALHWDGPQLLRRLGPLADGMDDSALAQAQSASGVTEGQIRARAFNDAPPPAALQESLGRISLDERVDTLIERIRQRQPLSAVEGYPAPLLVRLPRWPAGVGIRLVDERGAGILYEARPGTSTHVVNITRQELEGGLLADRVVAQLDEARLLPLFGDDVAPASRSDVLAQRLADLAQQSREVIFQSLDQARQPVPNAAAIALREAFTDLPAMLAQEVVERASDVERDVLSSTGQAPVRMAEAARVAVRQARLSRAVEGLYRPGLLGDDSARLAVRGLAWLKGWTGKVRLELRDASTHGDLLVSVGEAADAERKYLIRRPGGYQATDERGQELGAEGSLYSAILHALPDSERRSLGVQIGDTGTLARQSLDVVQADHDRSSAALGQVVERAWMRPYKARIEDIEYQASGRGVATPLERLRALYPGMAELDWAELKYSWRTRGLDLMSLARRLEQEYRVLHESLEKWVSQPSTRLDEENQPVAVPEASRRQVAERIRAAWRRETRQASLVHRAPVLALDLRGMSVGELPVLVADFSHVDTLLLNDMDIAEGAESAALEFFLKPFTGLQAADLSQNRLTRVPPALADMPHLMLLDMENNRLREASGGLEALRNAPLLQQLLLRGNQLSLNTSSLDILVSCRQLRELSVESNGLQLDASAFDRLARVRLLRYLRLGDNRITLMPEGVSALARLRGLYELDLRDNPLQLPPNVTGMLRLQLLNLRGTGIEQWPTGLEALMFDPGSRLLALDLANNAIVEVPALDTSEFAQRYRDDLGADDEDREYSFSISNNPLSEQALERVQRSGLAGQFVPHGGVSAVGIGNRDRWLLGCPEPLLSAIRVLEQDPEADRLFFAMRRLIETKEYEIRKQEALQDMWEVLRVVVAPSEEELSLGLNALRKQLFERGDHAEETCGDGIALLLQRCKVDVAVWKAAARAAADGPGLPGALLDISPRLFRGHLLKVVARDLYMSRLARKRTLTEPGEVLTPLREGDDLSDDDLRRHVPDEAEIMLKLKLALSARLDLIEAYSAMRYESHVSDALCETLAKQVLELELKEGKAGLKRWMARQLYWQRYLATFDGERFEALRQWRADAGLYLDSLDEAPVSRTVAAPVGLVEGLQGRFPGKLNVVDGVVQTVQLSEGERSRAIVWIGDQYTVKLVDLALELSQPLWPD